MKGALVFNKFYRDDGMDFIKSRLMEVFSARGVDIDCIVSYARFAFFKREEEIKKYDFALFFDKDIPLARFFERCGVRVINSSKTLEACDDKELTFSVVADTGIAMPKTIIAPLMYDVSDDDGDEFLKEVEATLKKPIVVKENVGSQGRQVYLAESKKDLRVLFSRLKHVPHMYQEYISGEKGSDTRVYVVGKKAVFAVRRTNTTDFRSNVFLGGKMEKIPLEQALAERAETIAKRLDLEYGSVDFLGENADIFSEANSNAYIKTADNLGANLAGRLADYVTELVYGTSK